MAINQPEKRASKPIRQRRRRIAALTLGVLLLAAALCLLLPVIKAKFPASRYPEPTSDVHRETLATGDPTALRSIAVRHIAGDGYTLEYRDGALCLREGETLLNINDATADEMLDAATHILVLDTVAEDAAEVKGQLGDMGLEPPQTEVTVAYTDGHSYTIQLGYGVGDTTYTYYRWSEDAGVYMCDVGVSDVFSMTANRLLPVSQPVLSKTLVDRVSLRLSGGELELGFAHDDAGYLSGSIVRPYRYPMAADAVNSVLTALENLRLGTLEGEITAENSAYYGFDDPLAVVDIHQSAGAYTTVDASGQLIAETLGEQSLRFTFGRAEGDYFYTCGYEGKVYLVSRFLAEALIKGSAEKWITRNPAAMGGALLSAVTVQTGTGTADIRIDRTERVLPNNQLETDADGSLVYDTTVTLNGEAISEEQLNAFLSRLEAMTVSGSVPETFQYQGLSPRWQLTLITTGGTLRTIAAYAMDAFSDALVVDGVMKHYVYREAILTALGELAAAVKP